MNYLYKANILNRISEEIKKQIEQEYNKRGKVDWGLYTGLLGMIIYLFYYARWTQRDEDNEYANSSLAYYLENIPITQLHYSYCSGLSGILVGLHHLNAHHFAEISLNDALSVLSDHIIRQLELDIHNHDFMYGTIGVGIMGSVLTINQIHDILFSTLLKNMVTNKNGKYLLFKVFNESRYIENISMSHGMSSVIIYLSMLSATKGVHQTDARIMVKDCVNYVLSQSYFNHQEVGSHFPYTSLKDPVYKSRLAWCYGDLGIATAIFSAGLLVDNEIWKNIAIQILVDSTHRLNTTDNCVVDACFCHGAAGISQIYNRMYLATNQIRFHAAAEYWINETLKYSNLSGGVAGYKTVIGNILVNECNLLEGIAGIGLAILASIDASRYSSWDSLFLLSFEA